MPGTWRDRSRDEGGRLEEKRFERFFSAGAGVPLKTSFSGRVGGSGGVSFVFGGASW